MSGVCERRQPLTSWRPSGEERAIHGAVGGLAWRCVWVLGCVLAAGCGRPSRCDELIARSSWLEALSACESAYARTSDPAHGLSAARAALYVGRYADATRLATALLPGPRAADARTMLGATALANSERGEAIVQLTLALVLHASAHDSRGIARDAHQLAGVRVQLGELGTARRLLETASRAADRAADRHMQVLVDLASADIACATGDLAAADRWAAHALVSADNPGDVVVARFKQGYVRLEAGHSALARSALERALADELAAPSPRDQFVAAARLNLAYLSRKAGRYDEALAGIEQARAAGLEDMDYHMHRGLVFADRGELARADVELTAAEAAGPEGEWRWWVAYHRALLAGKSGDAVAHERLGREAVARVAALAVSSREYGPSVIAKFREPHLDLIGLLASQGRWNDVLEIVAFMDAGTLLASREAAGELTPSSLSLGTPTRSRPEVLDDVVARVLAAWRGRHLVILVPGGSQIWRLDLRDGVVTGAAVGAVEPLSGFARALEADPGDAAAARAIEAALFPTRAADAELVEVLAIGPIGRAPLAAISTRRLARVPGVLPRAAPRDRGRRAWAIGNPTGDLPASTLEVGRLVARLRATALVGPAATRAAFAGVGGGDLLHVAAHTSQQDGAAVILLADGGVAASDIAALSPAPRLVVLATCASAVGRDDAGTGSLVNEFLNAGADAVVATRWSVGDADAAALIAAFYEEGGLLDPVRALVAAQGRHALSSTTSSAFEVTLARPVEPAPRVPALGRSPSSPRDALHHTATRASAAP